MNQTPVINWQTLGKKYGDVLVSELRASIEAQETAAWNPESLSTRLGVELHLVLGLLKELAKIGVLEAVTSNRCTVCGMELSEEAELENCPSDPDGGDHQNETSEIFRHKGVRSADIGWVLTIHGMNTRGPWQERFSWRLARIYRHSVPVAIYKYGHILITPLISRRQQEYVDRLLDEIRSRQDEAEQLGYRRAPTVIAHSFGTWLFAQVLEKSCLDGGERIDVGRVILTGSIIPPDYDWEKRIKEGQVEAILCHYSPVDFPVRLSHWMIPYSGPSGGIGFNDVNSIAHKKEPGFGHSDYFEPEHADRVWNEVWQPFLRNSTTANSNHSSCDYPRSLKKPWKPSRLRFLTHLVKWLLLTLLVALSVTLVACTAFGAYTLWRLFLS